METLAARKGFFRRLLSWRGALFLLASFVTLVTLLLAEENWRGGRAWQNYKREMEAKGERFDAARLIPPKVPDDQNFAMTPLFAPIFNLPPEDLAFRSKQSRTCMMARQTRSMPQPIAAQMSHFLCSILMSSTHSTRWDGTMERPQI